MRSRLLFSCAFLLIAFLGINHLLTQSDGSEDSDSPDDEGRGSEPRKALSTRDSRTPSRSKGDEFDQLISRWSVELKNYPSGPEAKALAMESVKTLGISDDLVALIQQVERSQSVTVGQAFARLLRSKYLSLLRPASGEVCQKLVGMNPESNLRNSWIYEAARFCDEEQLAAFMGDPRGAQAAIFGHGDRTVETDPKGSLTTVASELVKGRLTTEASAILKNLAKRVPLDADFAAIENGLPPDSAHVTIRMGRAVLLARWATVDPAGAVNHVMDNPERVDPGSVARMMEPFLAKDLPGAIDWLQEIPPGPHLDAALVSGVDALLIKDPEVARELAAKIENQILREKMLEKAKAHQLE